MQTTKFKIIFARIAQQNNNHLFFVAYFCDRQTKRRFFLSVLLASGTRCKSANFFLFENDHSWRPWRYICPNYRIRILLTMSFHLSVLWYKSQNECACVCVGVPLSPWTRLSCIRLRKEWHTIACRRRRRYENKTTQSQYTVTDSFGVFSSRKDCHTLVVLHHVCHASTPLEY